MVSKVTVLSIVLVFTIACTKFSKATFTRCWCQGCSPRIFSCDLDKSRGCDCVNCGCIPYKGFIGINAKNKGIDAFDELRSRFGKSQRETDYIRINAKKEDINAIGELRSSFRKFQRETVSANCCVVMGDQIICWKCTT